MPDKRLQYQAIAEPVLTEADSAAELSWYVGTPSTARGHDQSARFLAQSLFWYTETGPQPDRRPSTEATVVLGYKRTWQYQATAAPSFVPPVVEGFQPQFLTWWAKYPDRVYGKPPFRHQGRHQFFTPRLPYLPEWWQQTSEPVRTKPPSLWRNDFTVIPPLEETVTSPEFLRRWLPETNQPIFGVRKWQFLYPTREFQPDRQPEPRADGWLRHWPEPVRPVPTANHQWLYDPLPPPFEIFPPPPPPPGLDTWFQPTPVLVWGPVPTYQIGDYVFWYPEVIPLERRGAYPPRHFPFSIRHKRRRKERSR